MNILIVHAHHEPKSFSSSLANQAELTLRAAGHDVEISDLHAMNFDPVSSRKNFVSVKEPGYLKQQAEESHASKVGGFAPEIEAEIQKLETADAIIFSFPLWWFGMPAILKGWCDRVLASGRVYGGPQLYENGVGKSVKRGIILMTTGGGPSVYSGWGVNPAMDTILAPVQHGVFWFNGIKPLEPFVAWSPAHLENEERVQILESLDSRLKKLFDEQPIDLPPIADFPNWGLDIKNRYVVVVTLKKEPDERFHELVHAEQALLAKWKRQGKLIEFSLGNMDQTEWRAFLTFRASNRSEVTASLPELPLNEYFDFSITELARPNYLENNQ